MSAPSLFAAIVVLAIMRWMLAWLLERPALPEDSYRRPCLLLQWLRDPRLLALAIAPTLPGAVFPRITSWEALGALEMLRWAALIMGGVIAWTYSTYAPNPLLGRTHAADRLLLPVLAGCVWLHPMALPAFIVHAGVVARQFDHPSCSINSLTPIQLPMHLLMALGAWPAAAVICAPPPETLGVLVLSIAAAQYVTPGLTKLWIGPYPGWWALNNRIHLLSVTSYQYGWFSWVPEPRVLAAARALAIADRPAALGTLALELGSLAMLVNRDLALGLLVASAAMHGVIFACSGINFWKWVATDLALAGVVWAMPAETAALVFTPAHGAACVAIVLTQAVHLRCARLGWIDSRLCSFFRIEGVGVSGHVYPLPACVLAPYDVVFSQQRHYHLCSRASLTSTYGTVLATSNAWRVHREIEASGGRSDAIDDARRRFARSQRDERKSEDLERLVRSFVDDPERVFPRRHWWSVLAPPMHIHTHAPAGAYAGQEALERVRIRYRETWHDGRAIRTLLDERVRDIPLGAGASGQIAAAELPVNVVYAGSRAANAGASESYNSVIRAADHPYSPNLPLFIEQALPSTCHTLLVGTANLTLLCLLEQMVMRTGSCLFFGLVLHKILHPNERE